jgi:hypothetical protein
MNVNYGLTFFHFNLREVDYVTNDSWASGGLYNSGNATDVAVDLDMKRTLSRGATHL